METRYNVISNQGYQGKQILQSFSSEFCNINRTVVALTYFKFCNNEEIVCYTTFQSFSADIRKGRGTRWCLLIRDSRNREVALLGELLHNFVASHSKHF